MMGMKIRVGIVEDEKQNQDNLINLIELWGASARCETACDTFVSGEAITEREDVDYHVLFMDIKLPGMNGVDASKKLRGMGYTGEIIFLTAYREFVFDAFDVHAFHFLVKPLSFEDIIKCMNSILQSVRGQFYVMKKRGEIVNVPYHDIICILSNHHQMNFVTANEVYCHTIRIRELLQTLPAQFVQCHRTVILNAEHIRKLVGKDAYMSNGVTQPVSDRYLQAVRDIFESGVI